MSEQNLGNEVRCISLPACAEKALERSAKGSSMWRAVYRVPHLAALLVLLQVLDGFLTHIGISRFGITAEGNPFIREMMLQFGHVPVLFLIKCAAVLVILLLARKAAHIDWIPSALGFVSFFYLGAAILPWTYFLFILPYLA